MDEFEVGDVVRFREDWKAICQKNKWQDDYPDWTSHWQIKTEEKCDSCGKNHVEVIKRRKATVRAIGQNKGTDGLYYSVTWVGGHKSRVREEMIELVSQKGVTEIYSLLDKLIKDSTKRSDV